MRFDVGHVLNGLALAFTGYLAARGLWFRTAEEPMVLVAALALYLFTTWLCIFWDRGAPARTEVDQLLIAGGASRLPAWAGVLAVAAALIVPSAVGLGIGSDIEVRTQPYATWYIGGLGALMMIVMIRRRPWTAWIGTTILAVSSMLWLGPLPALALGLVGSVVWVTAAQLAIMSLDRAASDTTQLAQLQQASGAWQAAQTGRERERRIQVQRALAIAGPILARTIMTGGHLDEFERREARLAEGQLRDELRAPRLLDDGVRSALEAARKRGAVVTVLDEGGLEGVDEADLVHIREELAHTITDAQSDRLYIRTSPDDRVAVTVVGRSGEFSDEDSVDLWAEIAHRSPR